MTITIIGKEVSSISDEEHAALKALIFPGFLTPTDQPESLLDPKNILLYALIAYNSEQIVGLLICDFKEIYESASIKSLYAIPGPFKDETLNLLLSELEKECRKRKIGKISFVYADNTPFGWDDLLAEHDWYGKKAIALSCEWEDCRTFGPDWFKKEWALPKGCEIIPWKKKPEDEELNSLGLHFDNEIVGWIETKRVSPDTICYAKLFVDFAFRFTGAAIVLLKKSIEIQQKSEVLRAIFLINFQLVKPRWIRFIRKRLVPYAQKVTEYSQAIKKL